MSVNQALRDTLENQLPRIRRIVRRICRDQGVVDDIVQECCVRIIEKEELWKAEKGSAVTWINAVVRNFTIRFLSRGKRESRIQDPAAPRPTESVVSEAHIRWLLRQFGRLTRAQQETLRLKYYHGLNTVEMAERLGIGRRSVSDRLAGALTRLRKRAAWDGLPALLAVCLPSQSLLKGLVMTGKQKVVAAGVVFLTLGLGASAGYQFATLRSERLLQQQEQRASRSRLEARSAHGRLESAREDYALLKKKLDEKGVRLTGLEKSMAETRNFSDVLYELALEAEKKGKWQRAFKLFNILAQVGKEPIRGKVRAELAKRVLQDADDLLADGQSAPALWNLEAAHSYQPGMEGLVERFKEAADVVYEDAVQAEELQNDYKAHQCYSALLHAYEKKLGLTYNEARDLAAKLESLETPRFYEQLLEVATTSYEYSSDDPLQYPGYYYDFAKYYGNQKASGMSVSSGIQDMFLQSLSNLVYNRRHHGMYSTASNILSDALKKFPELKDQITKIGDSTFE